MSPELRRGNSLEERVWLKEVRRRKQKQQEGTQAEGWPQSHGNHAPTDPSWARRGKGGLWSEDCAHTAVLGVPDTLIYDHHTSHTLKSRQGLAQRQS